MRMQNPTTLIAVSILVCSIGLPAPAGAVGNPTLPANACVAGKIKCVIKQTGCLINCLAKAAKAGVALDYATDPCLAKCRSKFDGGAAGPVKSCFGKLEAKGGCPVIGDMNAIAANVDAFVLNAVARLDQVPLDDASSCRSGKLKCVIKYDKCVQGLFAKAAKSGGQIDQAKLAKCVAIVTGGSKGAAGSCFGKLEAKGGCETEGDAATLAAQDDAFIDDTVADFVSGQLDLHNERCSGDTSVKCSSAPGGAVGCGGPLGTCEFWFGAPQPLPVGGVALCATNRWVGAVTGTVDQQSGASAWTGTLRTDIYPGLAIDKPCAKCIGDPTLNDGVAGGTCSGGSRNGLACDANGTTSFAQFGATSLDCPLPVSGVYSSENVRLASNNTAASLTLSAASPDCTGFGALGKKCACASCSGDVTVGCATNADCALVAAGTCTNSAGEPRRPNSCSDDTFYPADGSLCSDVAPVGDGVGTCPEGPYHTYCAIDTFRTCAVATQAIDCPAPGDTCSGFAARTCFLDNGLIGGTILAPGGHSTPVNHASYSTFAAVSCLPPTMTPAVNAVFGFPGAGRMQLGGLLGENGTAGSCPTEVAFTVTNADGVQDLGWTGIAHDQRFVTQAKVTMGVTGCTGSPPTCGVCTFSGPVLNAGAVVADKVVFVTSTTTNGNIGNLAGADALCQARAGAASLSGTFKAWLSNASTSAAARLAHSPGDFVLVNGTVIANGWTDLTDGSLDAPIDRNEFGAHVPGTNHVWTGSTAAGAILGNTCGSWTLSAAANGHKGHSDATNTQWSDDPVLNGCGTMNRLYCFEQ